MSQRCRPERRWSARRATRPGWCSGDGRHMPSGVGAPSVRSSIRCRLHVRRPRWSVAPTRERGGDLHTIVGRLAVGSADVLRIDVPGLGRRMQRRSVRALVDRQDRHAPGPGDPTVVAEGPKTSQHPVGPVRIGGHPIDDIGTGVLRILRGPLSIRGSAGTARRHRGAPRGPCGLRRSRYRPRRVAP